MKAVVTFALCAGLANFVACSDDPSDSGAPVGSACTTAGQCAGPGAPMCLTGGLFPLSDLATSEAEQAQNLAGIGVPMPDGYCSTVPPCQTDADCSRGGTCFFPLREVDAGEFEVLVDLLDLPEAETATLMEFLTYGQCLQACSSDTDCERAGYVCATPILTFLELVRGADLSTFCIGDDPCLDSPCSQGSCTADPTAAGQFACTCLDGWEGELCDINTDDCDPNPCLNGGTCTDRVNDFTCACALGFTGDTCETTVASCSDTPCVHGSCADTGPGTYACTCDTGWQGANCDTNIDDCAGNACVNGSCVDGIDAYTCACDAGWQGSYCDQDEPDCAANPCVHGACTEGAAGTGAYTCSCVTGWDGDNCDHNIDDCAASPCVNGACVDEVAGFQCNCTPGWQGTLCDEDEPDCTPDPCVNGDCTEGAAGSGQYTCSCDAGWYGPDCDSNPNDCPSPNPCQNGGTCNDGLDAYTCACEVGFTGTHCETAVTGCADNPCVHGSCTDTNPGYTCLCTSGWQGVNCDTDEPDCLPTNPCQNGASCTEGAAGTGLFTCNCTPGWDGPLCADDFLECAANPCVHGSCIEGAVGSGEFTCDCPGWQGTLCDEDFPDCAADPCVNGACVEGTAGTGEFTCNCSSGWQGTLCNEDEPDCTPTLCENGGVCVEGDDGSGLFTCNCASGWTGTVCNLDEDDCGLGLCENGAGCSEGNPGTGEFTCDCTAGWDGPLCADDFLDCAAGPCLNGGTCTEGTPGTGEYSCACPDGWSGINCETPEPKCILTYDLIAGNGTGTGDDGSNWTGCNMRIWETDLSAGDGTWPIGPGTLILRVPSDGAGNPAGGLAEILYYDLHIEFTTVPTIGPTVDTLVDHSAPSLYPDPPNTTAQALGTLTLGGTPGIAWDVDPCVYSPTTWNDSRTSFTPDGVTGTGASCLAPYNSYGTVTCNGGNFLCGMGGLSGGVNQENATWEQTLTPLSFAADLSTVVGGDWMTVPNDRPARAAITWEGTLAATGGMICD